MNSINFCSEFCHIYCLPTWELPLGRSYQKLKKPLSISIISRPALRVVVHQPGAEYFVICIMTRDGKVELKTMELELASQLVLEEYYEFLLVFLEEEAYALPSKLCIDYTIPIIEDGKPLFDCMYSMLD